MPIVIESKVRTLIGYYDAVVGSPRTAKDAARDAGHEHAQPHRWMSLLERWGLVGRVVHDGRVMFSGSRKLTRFEVLQVIGRHADEALPRPGRTRRRPYVRNVTKRRAIQAAWSLQQSEATAGLFDPNEPSTELEALEFTRG